MVRKKMKEDKGRKQSEYIRTAPILQKLNFIRIVKIAS